MKWFVLLIVCAALVILVLPLRFVSQRNYVVTSKSIEQGRVSIVFDPHFYPARKWFGLSGLEGRSPYRVRVVLASNNRRVENFEVRSLMIDENLGKAQELPRRVAANPETDADGQQLFIVGYLDLPLDADTLAIKLVVAINGVEQAFSFEAKKISNQRIVHAGVEALSGL